MGPAGAAPRQTRTAPDGNPVLGEGVVHDHRRCGMLLIVIDDGHADRRGRAGRMHQHLLGLAASAGIEARSKRVITANRADVEEARERASVSWPLRLGRLRHGAEQDRRHKHGSDETLAQELQGGGGGISWQHVQGCHVQGCMARRRFGSRTFLVSAGLRGDWTWQARRFLDAPAWAPALERP
jgi:hypothetical protein